MRLYFMRHGEAEERDPHRSDAERALTPQGEDEMRRVAAGVQALKLEFDILLSSPLVRARQTAEHVARTLDIEDRLTITPVLGGGCRMGDLQTLLKNCSTRSRVLLIGHEPDFSMLVGSLIGGGIVRIRKASLACLDVAVVQPGGAELRWLLNPEHLAALAPAKE